jgi:hypothetical protein
MVVLVPSKQCLVDVFRIELDLVATTRYQTASTITKPPGVTKESPKEK